MPACRPHATSVWNYAYVAWRAVWPAAVRAAQRAAPTSVEVRQVVQWEAQLGQRPGALVAVREDLQNLLLQPWAGSRTQLAYNNRQQL
jgi:hypothetical protein